VHERDDREINLARPVSFMPLAPNFGPSLVISRRDTRVDVAVADSGHHARLNALGIIQFHAVTAISRRQAPLDGGYEGIGSVDRPRQRRTERESSPLAFVVMADACLAR
jgi:hypothetical protein